MYTYFHADDFGGVKGVVYQVNIDSGKVKIFALEGFMEHSIAENVFAGTVMSPCASYVYGNAEPPSEKRTIDGLEYEFLMAQGSEAPS
ncbi:hypothetical protein [uncultured Shewanella sp.]|uniref:hypothetical protein n=1 Tax=uncultured Shewanella sp. TaxID=173975 RepID=UPI00344D91AC